MPCVLGFTIWTDNGFAKKWRKISRTIFRITQKFMILPTLGDGALQSWHKFFMCQCYRISKNCYFTEHYYKTSKTFLFLFFRVVNRSGLQSSSSILLSLSSSTKSYQSQNKKAFPNNQTFRLLTLKHLAWMALNQQSITFINMMKFWWCLGRDCQWCSSLVPMC